MLTGEASAVAGVAILVFLFAPLLPAALKWGAYGLFGLMFAVIPLLIIVEHSAAGNYMAIVWGVLIVASIAGLGVLGARAEVWLNRGTERLGKWLRS